MRTIKFRVWDTEENKYFKPIYEAYDGKLLDLSIGLGGDLLRRTLQMPAEHESNFKGKYELEQFTGLIDKNGVEIYEGDLLREPAKDQWSKKSFVVHEVFWNDNDCADNHIGWQMNRLHFQGNICGTTDWNKMLPKYTAKMKVIGNIHQDKELISKT